MGKITLVTTNIIKGILPLMLVLLLTNCTKKPTEGTINVVNLSDNSPMVGASVKMYIDDVSGDKGFFLCNEGFVKERTVVTGAGGSITVCFQHPSVISLEVTHIDANSITRTGVGTLSLVQEETTKATVKVN